MNCSRKCKAELIPQRALRKCTSKVLKLVDKNGPALNAVIEVNPDAISIAESMDRERKDGKIRGPLHGIPVLVKDNIDTADKMMTTAGSLALDGHKATKDAFIIKRLERIRRSFVGKNKSQRMGQLQVQPFIKRVEQSRRTNKKSMCIGSKSMRIKFRFRSSSCSKSLCSGNRYRN